MFNFGILGINARNLHYIGKYNPAKAVRLADDKIKTKVFLHERGIPVPTTYAVIKDRTELAQMDFSTPPQNSFIIKPARGSRGRGIFRVKKLKESGEYAGGIHVGPYTSWRKKLFGQTSPAVEQTTNRFDVQGQVTSESLLKTYCLDILDGKESLQGKPDHILVEEMLVPGEGFEQFCEHGLADIRVIVYNFVPVAAMVRVPTEASGGKANLDRGGVGLGVEVGTGKIQSMYLHGEVYKKNFPEPYTHLHSVQLAYREDILHRSTQIQYYVNLGYLALDWVITDNGPKLLEINARAGLKIQLALDMPLRKRLEKISDLKISSPEKGVEICQTLFSAQKTGLISPKKVLHQYSFATIGGKDAEGKIVHDVTVEIDLTKPGAWMDTTLATKLAKIEQPTLQIGEYIKIPLHEYKVKKDLAHFHVILGSNHVQSYLVKPVPHLPARSKLFAPDILVPEEYETFRLLDNRISKVSSSLILSRHLKPTNFLAELDTFVAHEGVYNPNFVYQRPKKQKLEQIGKELEQIRQEFFTERKLESPLVDLFAEKVDELVVKQQLMQAYRKQDLDEIARLQILYWGAMSTELGVYAQQMLDQKPHVDRQMLGSVLGRKKIQKAAHAYLVEQGRDHVQIKFMPENYARMSAKKIGTDLIIQIASGTTFREHELYAALAHELTHIERHTQAGRYPWLLIRRGTARSFIDEEGLAVVAAEEQLPEAYEKTTIWQKYLWIEQARHLSFADMAQVLHTHSPHKSRLSIFKTAYRLKRGIAASAVVHPGAVSLQDSIYAQGYMRIRQWQDAGGDTEDLMKGKIKIEDLSYFSA